MTPEDKEYLAELEELKEQDEELDEDQREALRSLRAEVREEKRNAKKMQKWHKAGAVYRVSLTDTVTRLKAGVAIRPNEQYPWIADNAPDDFETVTVVDAVYALDLSVAKELAESNDPPATIEKIDRQSVTGDVRPTDIWVATTERDLPDLYTIREAQL